MFWESTFISHSVREDPFWSRGPPQSPCKNQGKRTLIDPSSPTLGRPVGFTDKPKAGLPISFALKRANAEPAARPDPTWRPCSSRCLLAPSGFHQWHHDPPSVVSFRSERNLRCFSSLRMALGMDPRVRPGAAPRASPSLAPMMPKTSPPPPPGPPPLRSHYPER